MKLSLISRAIFRYIIPVPLGKISPASSLCSRHLISTTAKHFCPIDGPISKQLKLKPVGDSMESSAVSSEPKSLTFIENFLNSWLKPSLYAEGWDNIGLLIGSGNYAKNDKMVSTILVCNDLTTAVTNEAIHLGAQLIVAYHPPIFSPIKRIGFSWKDSIISKCLANDISVYSPHTMLDSVPFGINDSIIQMLSILSPSADDFQVDSIIPNKSSLAPTREVSYKIQSTEVGNKKVHNLAQALQAASQDNDLSFSIDLLELKSTSEIGLSIFYNPKIHRFPDTVGELATKSWGFKETSRDIMPPGSGRIIKFKTGKQITEIQKTLQTHMHLRHLKVADTGKEIFSVAVCAGSGGSLLNDVEADLIITGELTHHEVLNCFENGKSVILCGHANSERHYLPTLAQILEIFINCPKVHVSLCDTNTLQWV